MKNKTNTLESEVKEFLNANPELSEALDLINMTEKEYCQALSAYSVAVVQAPTVGTGLENNVGISRPDKLWNSTSRAA